MFSPQDLQTNVAAAVSLGYITEGSLALGSGQFDPGRSWVEATLETRGGVRWEPVTEGEHWSNGRFSMVSTRTELYLAFALAVSRVRLCLDCVGPDCCRNSLQL